MAISIINTYGTSAVQSIVATAKDALSTVLGNDFMTILLFGVLYMLFGYASVIGYYISSMKKVNDGQDSIYGVISRAFILQIASLLLIWTLLMILNKLAQYSSTVNMDFATATLMFFKVNWLNVDIPALIQNYVDSGNPIEGIGMLLFIQAIWIVLTIVFIFVPIFLAVGYIFSVYRKINERATSSSQSDIIVGVISALLFVMVVLTIHFLLPAVFLRGMEKDNSSELAKHTAGLPIYDGYGYTSRAKDFIARSVGLNP